MWTTNEIREAVGGIRVMGSKALIHVSILIEVDEDKVDKVMDKIVDVVFRQLHCSASLVIPHADEFGKRIYVKAEFCNPCPDEVIE